jgi:hypothetical protein
MASLDVGTEPIVAQDIVNRFADWVTNGANAAISWGTNAYPFSECDFGGIFAGTTSGVPIAITGANVDTATNNVITASNIYNVLLSEATRYTHFRRIRAQLFVNGGGGNTGSRGSPGTVYNTAARAHVSTGYRVSTATMVANGATESFTSGSETAAATLENMMSKMYNSWATITDGEIGTWVTYVCHASCHSSCHSSRGRR